ncbi:hypothetical protein EWB00_001992 [Schistosoma japonicum]|uniref:Uncharacterized protein n=1 Tax=Schistosoma japonicum TaxID=6182 RepID=A0A4Z2CJY1_SCHJA|nr:hypothetical protein EWB00_001992 [Schistosoma japonicum]
MPPEIIVRTWPLLPMEPTSASRQSVATKSQAEHPWSGVPIRGLVIQRAMQTAPLLLAFWKRTALEGSTVHPGLRCVCAWRDWHHTQSPCAGLDDGKNTSPP